MTAGRRAVVLIATVVLIPAGALLGGPGGQVLGAAQRADELSGVQRLFALYERGDYDAFDRAVSSPKDVVDDWKDLDREARLWVMAAPVYAQERWRLVTASVALELASVHRGSWDRARALMEAGCRLLHLQPPTRLERLWHMAAASLAQTVADFRFSLLPDGVAPPPSKRPISPSSQWLHHGQHAIARFPDEPALRLAAGIALESSSLEFVTDEDDPTWLPPAAVDTILASNRPVLPPSARMDPAGAVALIRKGRVNPAAARKSLMLWNVAEQLREARLGRDGGEASMRLGHTLLRLARPEDALAELQRSELAATTPFVLYLARLFGGVALQRLERAEAVRAYREALEVIPRSQSATLGLTALLFQQGQRDEASDLVTSALHAPLVVDPIKYYKSGDAQAQWTARIALLRRSLR